MSELERLKRDLSRERMARRTAEAALNAARGAPAPAPDIAAGFQAFINNPAPMSCMRFDAVADTFDAMRQQGDVDIQRWIAANPDAVAQLAMQCDVLSANNALLEMLDVADVDMLRDNITWFFKGEYYAVFAKMLCAMWRGEKTFCEQTSYFALGRRRIDVEMRVHLPRSTSEMRRGVIYTAFDITAYVARLADLETALHDAELRAQSAAREDLVSHAGLNAENAERRVGAAVSDRAPLVLVSEDNPVGQRVIGAMLDALGAIAEFVGDGESAVEAARDRAFDLILMDVTLPGIDGVEATRRIRALSGGSKDAPIVAVTANAMPADRQKYLEAGMDDMVPKPIDGVALARAIARWTQPDEDDLVRADVA